LNSIEDNRLQPRASTVTQFFRSFMAVMPALLLAACVTVAPHTVSMDNIRGLKLVDVEITGAEVIRSWPDLESAYAKSPNADPEIVQRLQPNSVGALPPARDFIAAELRRMIKSEFDTQFADVFVGPRAARAMVHLKAVDIPSSGPLLIGGQTAVIDAEITLLDARSGAPMISYPGNSANRYLPGGLIAPIARAAVGDEGRRLLQRYMQQHREWLLRSAQS
jgi:hypothetical protein